MPGRGGDLYRVPGAVQRRGVRQIKIGDVGNRGAVTDRGGVDVDALGDLRSTGAEQLSAEEPAGGDVDPDGGGTRVVGLVIIRGRFDGDRVVPGLTGIGVVETGNGGDEVDTLTAWVPSEPANSALPPRAPAVRTPRTTRRA